MVLMEAEDFDACKRGESGFTVAARKLEVERYLVTMRYGRETKSVHPQVSVSNNSAIIGKASLIWKLLTLRPKSPCAESC